MSNAPSVRTFVRDRHLFSVVGYCSIHLTTSLNTKCLALYQGIFEARLVVKAHISDIEASSNAIPVEQARPLTIRTSSKVAAVVVVASSQCGAPQMAREDTPMSRKKPESD